MPRPMIPVGSYGEIRTRQLKGPDGELIQKWEARTRFRDKDGTFRHVRRFAKTKAGANSAIKIKLNALAEEVHSGKITCDTRFSTVAWKWHAEFREKSLLGGKSATSVRLYKGYLKNHILPRCGALTMDETTVGVLDGIIKAVHKSKSSDAAKSVKSVLGGIGRYAVVHGLWEYNRAHQVDEIIADDPKEVMALDPKQLNEVRRAIAQIAQDRQTDKLGRSLGKRGTVWLLLPDLVDAAAATGARLGEMLSLGKGAFRRDEKDRPVVDIHAHIIRGDDGKTTRQHYRKGSKYRLTLIVPEWSVPMWTRLTLAAAPDGPLFPGMNGGWLHPDDVSDKLGAALDDAGYPWVTAHVLRKTVGDVLDEAGHSVEDVAGQLGNTPKVARKHYTKTRARNAAQAATLEVLGGVQTGQERTG